MKVDDDSLVFIPHLYSWMLERGLDRRVGLEQGVAFGKTLDHYFFGSFIGFSSAAAQALRLVPLNVIGGFFEDWLLVAWIRIYGPNCTDLAFTDDEHINFATGEYTIHNFTEFPSQVDLFYQEAREVVVIHVKKPHAMIFWYETLKHAITTHNITTHPDHKLKKIHHHHTP